VTLATRPLCTGLADVDGPQPHRSLRRDAELLPQHRRIVLVVLQDGRQLEGELHTMSGSPSRVGGIVFERWEIETLEDLT
jgi:hypothetical protein